MFRTLLILTTMLGLLIMLFVDFGPPDNELRSYVPGGKGEYISLAINNSGFEGDKYRIYFTYTIPGGFFGEDSSFRLSNSYIKGVRAPVEPKDFLMCWQTNDFLVVRSVYLEDIGILVSKKQLWGGDATQPHELPTGCK